MEYFVTDDGVLNTSLELFVEEHEIVEFLAENYVKWVDPEEVTLDIVGLSCHWIKWAGNRLRP